MVVKRPESQSAAVGLLVLFVLMFSVLLSFFGTDAGTPSFAKESFLIGVHLPLIG
jgi:hypothetical protein